MTARLGELAWARSPFTLAGRLPIRAVALIALVGLAYHQSLGALARGLTLQTPLALLGLVPAIALVVAWIRLAREPSPRPIHDRQVDYIVGLAFIAIASAVLVLPPITLDARFWLYRIDLLSLPFFVAGEVALLWGVRRLWALRVPIGFLLLASPLPFTPFVTFWTGVIREAMAAAFAGISHALPFAHPAPGDGLVFYVGDGPRSFALDMGSAYTGVSLVGFVLIGSALAYVVRGTRARRVTWLAAGLAIVIALDFMRIEAAFSVGAVFGRVAAFGVLHPIAGLLSFSLGVLLMVLAAPRFGLRFAIFEAAAGESALRTPAPARRVIPALITAGVVALALALVNAGLARYEAIATPLAATTIGASSQLPSLARERVSTELRTAGR